MLALNTLMTNIRDIDTDYCDIDTDEMLPCECEQMKLGSDVRSVSTLEKDVWLIN